MKTGLDGATKRQGTPAGGESLHSLLLGSLAQPASSEGRKQSKKKHRFTTTQAK